MPSVKLLLNKVRSLKNGAYPLVFQIIHRRHKKLIYTPFKLFDREFDTEKQKIVHAADSQYTVREIRNMNRSLGKQRLDIEHLIDELGKCKSEYTASEIVSRYKTAQSPMSLKNCLDAQIRQKQESDKDSSTVAYRSTRASLLSFIGNREVSINQVDSAFVSDYVLFLKRRNVCENTICYYIRNFKAMYNQAITNDHRVPEEDPFRNLHIKPRKTLKRAVGLDIIRRIVELDLSRKPNLDIARDIFLFSFFARGMSFVDILYLKRPTETIRYSRKKTKQLLNISITPQIAALIGKHQNNSEYVFPILDSNHPKPLYKQYRLALERTNRNLKAVGKRLGLETPLTTYVARHSWATRAKKTGAAISAISEGLGHTSEKTTQIYLGELDQSVLDHLNEKVTEL